MADGTKQPAVRWEPMQTERCSQQQVTGWFRDDRYGIGLVGGPVSDGLVVIDIETKATCEKFQDACEDVWSTMTVVETPGHVDGSCGRHFYYKTEVDFTRKVIGEGDSAVDFRGAKHYCLGAGSPPSCHPTGRAYQIIQGESTGLTTLTKGGHEKLLADAREITGHKPPSDCPPEPTHDERSGDAYNEAAHWADARENYSKFEAYA